MGFGLCVIISQRDLGCCSSSPLRARSWGFPAGFLHRAGMHLGLPQVAQAAPRIARLVFSWQELLKGTPLFCPGQAVVDIYANVSKSPFELLSFARLACSFHHFIVLDSLGFAVSAGVNGTRAELLPVSEQPACPPPPPCLLGGRSQPRCCSPCQRDPQKVST